MKLKNITIIIILTAQILVNYSCNNQKSSEQTNIDKEQKANKNETETTEENPYNDLRSMALLTTHDQLGLELSPDSTIIYGIVMDWEFDGDYVSTVAYQTGDASLYFSTGGGIIGGGQHENVNVSAKNFVNLGQKYIDKSLKTENTTLPQKGHAKFYLLTNQGIFMGQENMKNLEEKNSVWSELFEEGNILISEIRYTTENL